MDSNNPYAAQEIEESAVGKEPILGSLAVGGGHLFVGKSSRMPHRCVFTNQPTSWFNVVSHDLGTDEGARHYVLISNRCRLKYSACTPIWIRTLLRMFARVSAMLGIGYVLVGLLKQEIDGVNMIGGAAMLAVGIVIRWLVSAPSLKVVAFERGMFKVEGCCEEFLDELARDPATVKFD